MTKVRTLGKMVSILLVTLVLTTTLPMTFAVNIQKDGRNASVDANIHLTRANLPLLQKAMNQIQDKQVRQLLQKIISMLTKKGIVTNDDIQGILGSFDNRLVVRTGLFKASSGNGLTICIPGLFLSLFFFYCGPVCVGSWNYGDFSRAGFVAYECCNGWFLGFYGFVVNREVHAPMHSPNYQKFYLFGISTLIIIKPLY